MNKNKKKKKIICNTMNDVPIGHEMIVKNTGNKVKLVEIRNFPTRFLCDDGKLYYTFDVDVIGWETGKPIIEEI